MEVMWMKLDKNFNVKLKYKTYMFYNEIAKILDRPIEDILSDTLFKYAEIFVRKANEDENKG